MAFDYKCKYLNTNIFCTSYLHPDAGLVSATWTGSQDVAFQNLRMFQSLGLAASFALAAFVGVTTKLYLLIGLLGLATTFYVAVEYTMRRRLDQRTDTGSI